MESQTILETSKYVRTIRDSNLTDFSKFGGHLTSEENKSKDYYLIYHSLFGNARFLPRDTFSFLTNARDGIQYDSAISISNKEFIDELLSLKYLVPKGYDERNITSQLLREREDRIPTGELLTSLQLILTNGCNFKCEYCFAYNFEAGVSERIEVGENIRLGNKHSVPKFPEIEIKNDSDWNKNHDNSNRNPKLNMPVKIAEAAIEHALENRLKYGYKNLSISLFGGEPTLNKSLIIHILNKYRNGEEYGLLIDWEITTNGSHLPDDMLSCFAKFNVKVAVSVDYINHETKSFRAGGQKVEKWEVIESNILKMIQMGIEPTLTSVLSKETWENWNYNLIDWASENNIKEINVIVSFQPEFFQQYNPDIVAEKLLSAFKYGKRKKVLLSGYWYQTYLLLVNSDKYDLQADYKTCPAIGRMLSIEPNGAVFSCKATNKVLGHVDNWTEIFSSPNYKEYAMRAYSNGPECKGCELEGTCSGGSAGQLEEANVSISKMSPGYCKYIRTLINGLLIEDLQLHEINKKMIIGQR